MMRIFVGLGLDAALAARLPAPSGIPGARWVEPHNLHLTLRFVGEVDEGMAQDLDAALADIAFPPFEMTLEGFGTFGNKKPHTLWVGAAPLEALARLHDKVEAAAVRIGLTAEPRKYAAHVTLARLNNSPIGRVQDFIVASSPFRAGPVKVERFTLFRSHLSRNGADYEMLAHYPLRGLAPKPDQADQVWGDVPFSARK